MFFNENGCHRMCYFSGAAFIFQFAGIFSTFFVVFFLVEFFGVLAREVSQKLIFDVFAAVCSGWECAFFPQWGSFFLQF